MVSEGSDGSVAIPSIRGHYSWFFWLEKETSPIGFHYCTHYSPLNDPTCLAWAEIINASIFSSPQVLFINGMGLSLYSLLFKIETRFFFSIQWCTKYLLEMWEPIEVKACLFPATPLRTWPYFPAVCPSLCMLCWCAACFHYRTLSLYACVLVLWHFFFFNSACLS